MAKLKVEPLHRELPISPAVSLLNTLLREGISISHDCGGRGRCGTCRVRIGRSGRPLSPPTQEERSKLGESPLEGGFRLACQTFAAGDVEIEIPPKEPHGDRETQHFDR